VIARTNDPLPLPIGTHVEFELPYPPASKKNGRVWRTRRGRKLLCPSDQAHADATMIALTARVAANGIEFGPDDALRIDYEHVLEGDTVRVRVTKVGTLPARNRGTKRDVHGMVELLADALQGELIPNDNQVDEIAGRRVRT
jgi:Holliday junction resolvase RusA-like endonuclease